MYLAYIYIFFIYYSQLEKEEKNAKEGKEKVETEKVKREAVQVVVPSHRNQVTFLLSDLVACAFEKRSLTPFSTDHANDIPRKKGI